MDPIHPDLQEVEYDPQQGKRRADSRSLDRNREVTAFSGSSGVQPFIAVRRPGLQHPVSAMHLTDSAGNRRRPGPRCNLTDSHLLRDRMLAVRSAGPCAGLHTG